MDESGIPHLPKLGFGAVGVKSSPASFGVIPQSVQWNGFLNVGLRMTSPPRARTWPTVLTPTCPLGMDLVSCSSVAAGALLTEAPRKRPAPSSVRRSAHSLFRAGFVCSVGGRSCDSPDNDWPWLTLVFPVFEASVICTHCGLGRSLKRVRGVRSPGQSHWHLVDARGRARPHHHDVHRADGGDHLRRQVVLGYVAPR